MAKAPNVYAISGAQQLLARRHLQATIEEVRGKGYRIEFADGARADTLRYALSADGLFEGRVLIVVNTPQKAPLDLIEEHRLHGNPNVTLMLFVEGNLDGRTKFGKYVRAHVKHKDFPVPSRPWEAEAAAEAFCVAEAKNYGKKLSGALAAAIVERVGTDFGLLFYEMQKICLLADVEGEEEVSGRTIRRTLVIIAEAEMQPAIAALAAKNAKQLCRTLKRVRDTTSPTGLVMRASSAMEFWAYRALAVVELRERGIDAGEAAIQLNQNDWYYRNKLLPSVASWSRDEVVELIAALAASQRAVLSGHLDPWTGFQVRLLRACGVG